MHDLSAGGSGLSTWTLEKFRCPPFETDKIQSSDPHHYNEQRGEISGQGVWFDGKGILGGPISHGRDDDQQDGDSFPEIAPRHGKTAQHDRHGDGEDGQFVIVTDRRNRQRTNRADQQQVWVQAAYPLDV